jgi:hypothetical protein
MIPNLSKIARIMTEDRRLVILRCMSSCPEYKINNKVLSLALDEQGHMVNHDILMSDIAWLTEQGLIKSNYPAPDYAIATLTLRGLDAAEGKATVPGVKRPDPTLED